MRKYKTLYVVTVVLVWFIVSEIFNTIEMDSRILKLIIKLLIIVPSTILIHSVFTKLEKRNKK